MRDLRRDEGTALITAILIGTVIMGFSVLLAQLSVREVRQASFQEQEDVTLAATEAMLERYATKLTLDPAYYFHRVDEAERTRVCTDVSSVSLGVSFDPGSDWDDSCGTWDYVDPPDGDGDGRPDWWVHPLFDQDGDPATLGSKDAAVMMEVAPPGDGEPVRVTVVGRRGDSVNRRAISASVRATALSEFARVAEGDISFGSGAILNGPVYSGDDLDFASDNETFYNIYAEDQIFSEPIVRDDAVLYDGRGEHEDIREVFPEPLDFNNFWDDLDLIRGVACDAGAGICLDDADATAWMLHPYVSAGIGRIAIWKSTVNPPTNSCLNSDEWWILNPEPALPEEGRNGSTTPAPAGAFSDLWTLWDDVEYPDAGVVWANEAVVMGYRGFPSATDSNGDGFKEIVMKGGLTVYAGSSADSKNITINADILLSNETGFTDVLGLAASESIAINPYAISTVDRELETWVAWLGQSPNSNFTSRACGRNSGNGVTPPNSVLDFHGSRASRSTSAMSGSALFSVRNYQFDDRLAFLRPPFWPLLVDQWRYEDWQEDPLPPWGRIEGVVTTTTIP